MASQRPQFELVQCDDQELLSERDWVPIISCVAGFPPEIVGFPLKFVNISLVQDNSISLK